LFFPIQQAQTIAQTVIVIAYMVMIFANSVVLYYVANELYFQVRVFYQFSFKFLYFVSMGFCRALILPLLPMRAIGWTLMWTHKGL